MKQRTVIFITTIIIISIGVAFSATLICQQDITEDTVWSLSESPILIYGNLTITNNAILTIKQGVEVLFVKISGDGGFEDGSELHLEDGVLIAQGSEINPILFSSAEDFPSEGDWGCIAVEGDSVFDMEHTIIEYARTGLCLWNMSTFAESASIINYNEFNNNSEQAILCYNASPQLNYNIIMDNETGVKILGSSYPQINHNDICDNSSFNYENNSTWDQSSENNWWGSTVEDLIELYIYDEDDDMSCGYVDYKPYLFNSITEGGGGNYSPLSLGMIKTFF